MNKCIIIDQKVKISLAALLFGFFIGCSQYSEYLMPINTNDLDEVEFVRKVIGRNTEAIGKYEVLPGSKVTIVKILSPSQPTNENELRQSMIRIKNAMRETFHREPNKLRFVFKDMVIEE